MHFGPTFLKNHDPYLPPSRWFGKQRSSLLVYGDIDVNNDFSDNSPEHNSCHVDAMFADCKFGEEVFDPVVVFGKR